MYLINKFMVEGYDFSLFLFVLGAAAIDNSLNAYFPMTSVPIANKAASTPYGAMCNIICQ